MKKILFSVATIFAANLSFSQIGTYSYTFANSDELNDFTIIDGRPSPRELPENFFTYSSIDGITNGALIPPDFVRYNNTVLAQYKWNIKKDLNKNIELEISFKYDNSLLNVSNSFQPVVSFNLISDHYLNGYYTKRSFLTGDNYGERNLLGFIAISSDSGGITTKTLRWKDTFLIDGHWYKAKITLNPTSDNLGEIIYVKEEVFDLGISGMQPQNSLGSIDWNFYSDVENVQEFTLQLFSHKNGGVKLVDNLIMNIDRGTHLNTQENKLTKLSAFPNPTNKILNIINPKNGTNKIEIFDTSGKLVLNKSFANSENKIYLDVENLPKGIYVYKIGELSSKLIKN